MNISVSNEWATYQGKGVHTGELCSLHCYETAGKPLKIILEKWDNCEFPSDDFPNFMAHNGTVLQNSSGEEFSTPEHLLAACLVFWKQPIQILVKGKETPIGDGSALPMLSLLGEALEKVQNGVQPDFQTYPSRLEKDYPCSGGEFKVAPADSFSVSYQFKKGDFHEEAYFSLNQNRAMATFFEEIAPARTFIFWKEYQACLKKGLLKGADPLSGIVVADSKKEYQEVVNTYTLPYLSDYPFLNRKGVRMENEFAKHKILDLMGDLAIINLSLPKLKIEITNGSHFQNHLLIKDLIYERKNQ